MEYTKRFPACKTGSHPMPPYSAAEKEKRKLKDVRKYSRVYTYPR
jgi:hypothetical protein